MATGNFGHVGDSAPRNEGLRERKRRETTQRIVEVGVRLFIEQGIDATTLDEIATGAGISRRTFFYYFKSKDDILLSLQSGMGEILAAALRNDAPGKRPLAAVRDAVMTVNADYPADRMIAIDRLMRSSESVQARKQAGYIVHEMTLFNALCRLWPDEQETALRLVAMAAIGAIRISLEAYGRADGRRPLVDILDEAFNALEGHVAL